MRTLALTTVGLGFVVGAPDVASVAWALEPASVGAAFGQLIALAGIRTLKA